MDTLSQDQLKLIAGLVANRDLTEAERESRALPIGDRASSRGERSIGCLKHSGSLQSAA